MLELFHAIIGEENFLVIILVFQSKDLIKIKSNWIINFKINNKMAVQKHSNKCHWKVVL